MDDRAIATRAADRLEGDVDQRVGVAAEALKGGDHVDLGQLAFRGFRVEPAQELDHRCGVAQMRRLHACDFGGVLARFRQDAGIGRLMDLGVVIGQQQRDGQRCAVGVDKHRAFDRLQRGGQAVGRQDRDLVAQMGAQVGVEFRVIGKKLHRAIVEEHREGLHHRVAGNVGAANVEKPADRVRQGEDGGRDIVVAQRFGQTGAFLCCRFACEFRRVNAGRFGGRGRAVVPDAVHEVLALDQRDAGAFQPLADFRDLGFGMQPRIEADLGACVCVVLEPVGGFHLGPVHRREMAERDLGAHLHPVAAIDEDARDLGQGDAEACRSGEARQPPQPRIAGRDVLSLMRIGAGNDEAVEPRCGHGFAQRRQPGRAQFGARLHREILKHQIAFLIPRKRARARGSLSKREASCSVMAPASCSTSVIVTACW